MYHATNTGITVNIQHIIQPNKNYLQNNIFIGALNQ